MAFTFADHDVTTLITRTANLDSNDDMELTSAITQELKVTAESTGEAQPGKKDKTGTAQANTSADNSASVAITVGVINNQSRTIIEGTLDTDPLTPGNQSDGAQLDSMRALRILSGVTYPFLTRPDEFVPTSAASLSDKITSEGFDAVNDYLDGTAGLKNLFNTWARATTAAGKVAVAGSINVMSFTNVAESIVQSGAQINQDPFYRPSPDYYTNPDHDPTVDNDNVTHSANANNVDQHVVSIEAVNYMQLMNVTGVFGFKLPSASVGINGIDDVDMSFDASLTPTKGGRGGIGGAIFLQFLDNTTQARVEEGVKLYSGRESGLNVKAEEAIMGFAFSQAGASAGKLAVGGTFSYFQQDSDILAHIDGGSLIEGGRVDVYAGAMETQINWAGGVAKSEAIGAGIAVAINNTDRRTRAVIGALEEDTTPPGDLTIDVAGAVTARASVAGGLYTFTVAGALANAKDQSDSPSPSGGGNAPAANNDDPLDGVSLPILFGDIAPQDQAQQPNQQQSSKRGGTAVGIAAAAAVNNIVDETRALVRSADITADAVDVKANNRNTIVSATGGLAFSKTNAGGNAVALAGAFSYNRVDAVVDAAVEDAQLRLWRTDFEDFVVETTDTRLSITADNATSVWTLAAGGAGAVSAGQSRKSGGSGSQGGSVAGALAGSVALNDVTGSTRATLVDSDVTMLGANPEPRGAALQAFGSDDASDIVVRATDDSSIFAIAGSLSFAIAAGNKGGGTALSAGVAISVNKIATDTEALVDDAILEWTDEATGGLVVSSSAIGEVKAFTVAGSLAAAVGDQQGSGVAASGAGSGSVNRIDADVEATLRDSEVEARGDVSVLARNEAEIIAGAGAVAIAFGVASQGTAAGVSIGGAFAINMIEGPADSNTTWATIENSRVEAKGDIEVDAESLARIVGVAIGAAGSVAGSSQSSAFGVAVGGSVGVNKIRNSTQARVTKGSTLDNGSASAALTTNGSVGTGSISIGARDESSISAVAGAAALSLAATQQTAVAASLGISVSVNRIENDVVAQAEDSTLDAGTTITVAAESEAEILSVGFGIGLAVAISGNATAVSVAATGALTFNFIDNDVEAKVGNTATGTGTVLSRGAISVTADDDSSIDAYAVAASASISGSTNGTTVAVSIGLALAQNRIDKDVTAELVNLPSVTTGGGDIVVDARDGSRIQTASVAASIALALGAGTSISVAGGAAVSTNVVLARVNATVDRSNLGSAESSIGKLDVLAHGDASIKSDVGALAASLAVGKIGVAVSIGVSVARNFIGWDPYGSSAVSYDYESGQAASLATLEKGKRVKITEGAFKGEVYEYIGETASDADRGTPGNQRFDLENQQYRDTSLWKHVNARPNAGEVKATVADSSILAGGAMKVEADNAATIDARVGAASIAVGIGAKVGVAVSGAGVYAENKIRNDVGAAIDGDGEAGITAASVSVRALDSSGINSVAGAASLAAGIGLAAGVGVSLGLSLSFNEVDNRVAALIDDADGEVSSTTGDITIEALTQGRKLFNLTAGDGITTAQLDNAGTADRDNQNTPGTDEALVDERGDRTLLAALRAKLNEKMPIGLPQLSLGSRVEPEATWRSDDATPRALDRGMTVRVDGSHTAGGTPGTIYRYVGASSATPVNLRNVNYASGNWLAIDGMRLTTLQAGQSWQLVGPDGETFLLVRNADGSIGVSKNTINAVSAAASLAAGFGKVGVAVSGAGAVAQNVILGTTNAYANDSVLDSAGDVTANASSTSAIASTVVAASAAVAGGLVGVGASIGVAVAQNFIGWRPGAVSESALEVKAYLQDTSVRAADDLAISALASQRINANVLAGSAALGAGKVGVGIAGAGVWAENKIGVDVFAGIDGDRDSGTVGIVADSIRVVADDVSSINAIAGAASLAAGFGLVGGGVSVAVALARNTITSDVVALIEGADALPVVTDAAGVVTGDADFGVRALGGDGIVVQATENASIRGLTAAASLAIGGGLVGVAISGAGADAHNVILTSTQAGIRDSAVSSAGAVDIDASNTATIEALVIGASAALGVGAGGLGASIGVSVARNQIGYRTDDQYAATYRTGDNPASVANGQTVRIAEGVNAGNVYRYIGTSPLLRPTDPSKTAENNNWLTRQDYSDRTRWQQVNLAADAAEVSAFVEQSNLTATGALTVDAFSTQTIKADVAAMSVAMSGGIVGVSLAGAGAGAENRIKTDVRASIEGDKDSRGVSASSVALAARDTSNIDALTGAAAVAVSLGGVAASLAIGVAVAINEIDTDVAAGIEDADAGVRSTSGDITITATSLPTIDAISAAAAVAAAIGGGALAFSGAGVYAGNVIVGSVEAYASDSVLNSANDTKLRATNTATINATTLAVAASVAVGAGGLGLGIGAAVASNLIGYRLDGSRDALEVQAYLERSASTSARDLDIDVVSSQTINAIVGAGAVAISGGGYGIGLSGAGSSATNRIGADVQAYIDGTDPMSDGQGTRTVLADSIGITATDTSTILARAGTASVAAAVGTVGASLAVGVSIARNEVANRVSAYIANAAGNGQRVSAREGGDITISATENATIDAFGVSASVALGGGFVGLGFAGAGIDVTNVVRTKTNAYIDNSVVDSKGASDGSVANQGGDIVLTATDTSTITARVGGIAGALGAGAVSGAIAIGVAESQNLIGWTMDGTADPAEVRAYVQDSGVDAKGSLSLNADANPTITSEVLAGSVALSLGAAAIGGAGAGASTANRIKTDVKAFIDGTVPRAAGTALADRDVEAASITLTADDRSIIRANTESMAIAGSLGALGGVSIAVGVAVASNEIANVVAATIADAALVKAGSGGIDVSAIENATIDAEAVATSASVAIGGGLGVALTGAGSQAINVIQTQTLATVSASRVESGGDLEVRSTDTSSIDAIVRTTAASGSAGAVSGAVAIGGAVARNYIGWGRDAAAGATYTTASNPASVTNGQSVKVTSGADAGSVYRYIGTTALSRPAGAGSDWLARANFADGKLWQRTNFGKAASATEASITASSATTTGAITVDAASTPTITADIQTLAAAGSVGIIAIAASGAGVDVRNEINGLTKAYIANTTAAGIDAGGTVTIEATDTATVTARARAVSYSASFGVSAGAAIAVSVSRADNVIDSTVQAYATESKIKTTGSGSNLEIEAREAATITTDSKAAALAISNIVAVGVGGSKSTATINTVTQAWADPVELDVGGDVTVDAVNTGTATSTTQGSAYAIAFIAASGVETDATATVTPLVQSRIGGYADERRVRAGGSISVGSAQAASATATSTGASVSIGLGFALTGPRATAEIKPRAASPTVMNQAWISGGTLVTGGGISVLANYNSDPGGAASKVTDGSGARATSLATAGGLVGVSGATATATDTPFLDAYVASGATLQATGSIIVAALSATYAEATAKGQGDGLVGVGSSKALATAQSNIESYVAGDVGGPAGATGGQNLTISASSADNAKATSQAVSGGLVAVSDGGSGKNDTGAVVSPNVQAYVSGTADINIAGALTVRAAVDPEADASTRGVANGFVGVGGSTTDVTLRPVVSAYMAGGSRIVAGLNVTVEAINRPTTRAGQGPTYQISGVDRDGNTLTVSNHGLVTGTAV